MSTRSRSWRDIVREADPDWEMNNRRPVAYEFTAAKAGNDERTHIGMQRVFYETTANSGPYTEQTPGLTWGGEYIQWNGENLTWGGE